MKINSSSIVFFTVLLTSFIVYADPIPSGSAQSITVGCVITTSGTYRLSNDIVGTVTINADNVTLNLDNRKITGVGSAIEVAAHHDIAISNGIITNPLGIGVLITTCTNVFITDVTFVANSSPIRATTSSVVIVDECTFRESVNVDGSAATGGLISYLNVADSIINKCIFDNNETVFVINANTCVNTQILSSDFENNTGANGLVLIIIRSGINNHVQNCVIGRNSSLLSFAGINSDLNCFATLIESCIISRNVSVAGNFLGIALGAGTVQTSIVTQNTAGLVCRGIQAQSNNITVDRCLVKLNTSSNDSIGIDLTLALNSFVNQCIVLFNTGSTTSSGIVNNPGVLPSNVFVANQSQGHGLGGSGNYVNVATNLITTLNPNTGVYNPVAGPKVNDNISIT